MDKSINKVKEIDVATVSGNKTLAAAVDRRALKRCKDAIEKFGIAHTPIVGVAKDGNRILLSGQCELTALRELGAKKMDAVEVDVSGDERAKEKLSLLLLSLRDRPGALCEGQMIQDALNAGWSRGEVQGFVDRSASWVSNRVSLVTRLDSDVYELVRSGLLEARSAEEVARLPQGVQFVFAEIVVREGLPKSAVQTLVSCYNDDDCPNAVKAQILTDPRQVLKRAADKRRSVNTKKDKQEQTSVPPDVIGEIIKSVRLQMASLRRVLLGAPSDKTDNYKVALKELETSLLALRAIIQGIFYPGKNEEGAR